MTAITLLAHADHGAAGVSDAVDVSDFAVLRLDTTAAPNYGDPMWDATIDLETAPAATGPWRQLVRVGDHGRLPVTRRSIVNGFDAFVRVRWNIGYPHHPSRVVSFAIGITGDAKPDTAG